MQTGRMVGVALLALGLMGAPVAAQGTDDCEIAEAGFLDGKRQIKINAYVADTRADIGGGGMRKHLPLPAGVGILVVYNRVINLDSPGNDTGYPVDMLHFDYYGNLIKGLGNADNRKYAPINNVAYMFIMAGGQADAYKMTTQLRLTYWDCLRYAN